MTDEGAANSIWFENHGGLSRRDFLASGAKTGAALMLGCFLDGRIAVVDAFGGQRILP